jgi:putative transposase
VHPTGRDQGGAGYLDRPKRRSQVYPNEIRKIIYTTNAIESLHMQLRKVLKTRGHFPSDEAATKLIYLVLRDITKKWKKPPITWKLAATQFAIRFGQRFFAVEI